MEFGLQLFSVRNSLKEDTIGTLEKISEIGYKNIQITRVVSTSEGLTHVAGNLSAAEINKQMDRLGMKIINVHADVNEQTDWDRLIDFHNELGASGILLPMAYFTDKQSAIDLAYRLNKYGEICRKNGIDFYYHNHFQEFKKFDGQTIMDILVEQTEKELVKFELDTFWAARGGVDPIHWLIKLGDRCDITHQKDMTSLAVPMNWYDHFGHDANITLKEILETKIPEQFTEIGEGIMDIPKILQTMRDIGVKYVFVEQDETVRSELESIAISFRNMSVLMQG